MVASSLAVTLLLLSVMPPLGEAKKCSDDGVLEWTADSCVFVVNTRIEYAIHWNVHTACRGLIEIDNGSQHDWHLPMLDSIEKQKTLYGIMREAKMIEPEGTVFWINLDRSYPDDNESWSDPKKWYWTDHMNDDSWLNVGFGGKLPWAENQPDNAAGVAAAAEAGINPSDKVWLIHLEKCVVAKTKPTSPWFEWSDEPCYKDGNAEWNESFRLLCEGRKIPPSNDLANQSATTSSATAQHPLVWIIVGLVLVIVLISAIAIAVACKDRIRRCKKSIGMTWHRSWGDQNFDQFWSDSTKIPTGSSTDRRRVRRSKPNDQLKKKQGGEDKDKLKKAQV